MGPAKTLERLTALSTQPVALEDRDATFSETTTLALPAAERARSGGTARHRPCEDPPSDASARADPAAVADTNAQRKVMKLFGTDGLRGKAGDFPLDPPSVRRLGRELGRRLSSGGAARVVVGGDTRESTPWIVASLAAGLREGGCNVASAGVITTPGVAELVLELGAASRSGRLRLAQSVRGQRHQDLRIRRTQVAGRGGGIPREPASRRARPGRRGPGRAPAARSGPGPDRDLRLPAAGERHGRASTGSRSSWMPATARRFRSAPARSSARARA